MSDRIYEGQRQGLWLGIQTQLPLGGLPLVIYSRQNAVGDILYLSISELIKSSLHFPRHLVFDGD